MSEVRKNIEKHINSGFLAQPNCDLPLPLPPPPTFLLEMQFNKKKTFVILL